MNDSLRVWLHDVGRLLCDVCACFLAAWGVCVVVVVVNRVGCHIEMNVRSTEVEEEQHRNVIV